MVGGGSSAATRNPSPIPSPNLWAQRGRQRVRDDARRLVQPHMHETLAPLEHHCLGLGLGLGLGLA